MRNQVDFLLPLKLQKICYFGLCCKILLANQFAGFFTFDLFDLLILIPGVHCYIALVNVEFEKYSYSKGSMLKVSLKVYHLSVRRKADWLDFKIISHSYNLIYESSREMHLFKVQLSRKDIKMFDFRNNSTRCQFSLIYDFLQCCSIRMN